MSPPEVGEGSRKQGVWARRGRRAGRRTGNATPRVGRFRSVRAAQRGCCKAVAISALELALPVHAGSNGQIGTDSVRELILLNSHDGTSSYQLMSGVFRTVCRNGLIVSEGEAQMIRVPH